MTFFAFWKWLHFEIFSIKLFSFPKEKASILKDLSSFVQNKEIIFIAYYS